MSLLSRLGDKQNQIIVLPNFSSVQHKQSLMSKSSQQNLLMNQKESSYASLNSNSYLTSQAGINPQKVAMSRGSFEMNTSNQNSMKQRGSNAGINQSQIVVTDSLVS